MHLRKLVVGLTLGLALVCCGCPNGEKAAPGDTSPTNAGTVPEGVEQSGKSRTETAATPAVPEPPAEPPNPRPTGANWVWTPELRVRIGHKLQVQYRIEQPNPGKAWIGLIPTAIVEQDEASNDAADVAFAYTVDAQEAALNLDLPSAGSFVLRLFDSDEPGAKLLAESTPLTVEQWPSGDLASLTPPYLTINAVGVKDGRIEIQQNFPVIVYFEIPADYPEKPWIGVIPASVKSPQESDNDAADVQFWYVEKGQTKGQFTWQADKLGTYVFRLFPADVDECDYSAQSETFTIVPKAK